MGRWTREELEAAFREYLATGARAVTTGDWSAWCEQFTEDCTYVEHHFGRFEERGWVVCSLQNVMPDPGDGSIHQTSNLTVLHHAGDGKWSYEEDAYNPANFVELIKGWMERKQALEGSA